MKISESWLREWVSPKLTTDELVAQVTMAGLEVDGTEPAAAQFSGVVVGEILSAEQHPDADKLRVCQVAGHPEGTMQVVCGAANARPGIKIPFALVGSTLPPGEDGKPFKIKKAKLRGVESFGMLCGADELGLSEEREGIMELPLNLETGADLREVLSLDDTIIEIDLTPNRADCLSVRGLARDVGVLNGLSVIEPAIEAVAAVIDDVREVSISAPEAGPKYVGRVVKGVDVTAATPLWMVEKLRRSGIRSIDPVVDITNYVLLELGQPMHAFDLNLLQGDINVRMASEGEQIETLDGQERTLKADTLVIADDAGAVAIAGVMGGQRTAVNTDTKDIFFESAFFVPEKIAGKARNYGLHTDSSHRFERGVDSELQTLAIERATALLVEICGGQPGPVTETVAETRQLPVIEVTRERIASYLSIDLTDERVEQILTGVGLTLANTDAGWACTVPSWRFDMSHDVDVIEEIARIYGYNNLPTTSYQGSVEVYPGDEKTLDINAIRNLLVARGYTETINYSFVEPKLQAMFDAKREPVAVQNPISADMSVMRTTMLPGLAATAVRNIKRQQSRVRIFETGLTFEPSDSGLVQASHLGMLVYGSRNPSSWHQGQDVVDFFDIKADVEALLAVAGGEISFAAAQVDGLHPGQTAEISKNGAVIGFVGALHPSTQKALGVDKPVFVAQLAVAALLDGVVPAFKGVSKFPEINRDLAFVVDADVPVAVIEAAVKKSAGDHLIDLKVFDIYQGEGIENHRKSVALGLTFQSDSRTLTDEEITQAVESVVDNLKTTMGAVLRG